MSDKFRTVEVRVTGRVQGVSFRWWTRGEARALGIRGWVRNETDGSVRALLHGPATAVDQLLARLHEGPPGARVDDLALEEAASDGVPEDFEITR